MAVDVDLGHLEITRPPIAPEIVAWLLLVEMYSGASFAMLSRTATAVGFVHESYGYLSPTKDPVVAAFLKHARKHAGKETPVSVEAIEDEPQAKMNGNHSEPATLMAAYANNARIEGSPVLDEEEAIN